MLEDTQRKDKDFDPSVTLCGNEFNSAPYQLVQLDWNGSLPALDGSNLINVETTLPVQTTMLGNSVNVGSYDLVQLNDAGILPSLDGSLLYNLPIQVGPQGDTGDTGTQGETGLGFTIAKIYSSAAELGLDHNPW